MPLFPHGVKSEDGFYKVVGNETLLWFQLCDGMIFNHYPPECVDCLDCGGPSHCSMGCSALVAKNKGGYDVCTTVGRAASMDINIIDKNNPHIGVIVKMSSNGLKENCSLSVSVMCDPKGFQGPSLLEKTGKCDYATTLKHPSGCAKIVHVYGKGWGWFATFLIMEDQDEEAAALNRFNATLMLETLQGKRMMFVGDSLNRGQYVSMICLLHSLIPDGAKSMETFDNDQRTVFTAKDYNATIEFYWAPFLLESNSDNAVNHRISERLVRKGSMNYHGKHWKGVDVLVFNTYLWWMTGLKFKILQGSFEDEVKDIVEVPTTEAYRMAMKSMLRWVRRNMDRNKTRVFFTSMSPSHGKSIDWKGEPNGNCYNQTTMIDDRNYWGSDSRKNIMEVIGQEFRKSKVPISFLNITQLSSYRKDAHTSIYKKQWSPLTPEQLANPVSYADCVHWCLPGLQDTWNELLFAKMFYP